MFKNILGSKKSGALQRIKKSGLVLEEWYFSEYPEVSSTTASAAEHYATKGWKEGKNPNPYFDTLWYIENVIKEPECEKCPLVDYLNRTKKTDTSAGISVSEYCNENIDAIDDPLLHYITIGIFQNKYSFPKELSLQQLKFEIKACGLFDEKWYLEAHSDLRESGVDALEHYCLYGWKEGRRPNPYFDSKWYQSQQPEETNVLPPLLHYAKFGWRGGISPSQDFDANKYLSRYPDVKSAGVDPLRHYLEFGFYEGRTISPVHKVSLCSDLEDSGLFLKEWYENHYEDLRDSGLNMYEHYILFGANEGRNPNPYFDTSWYMDLYGEYIPEGENPLLYYSRVGWKKNHNPSNKFDAAHYREEYLNGAFDIDPLKHYLQEGKKKGNKIKAVNVQVSSSGGRLKKSKEAKLVTDISLRALLDQFPVKLNPISKDFDPKKLDIHWVIPDFSPGAGGHMTIFRVIRFLEFFGHKNTIWVYNPTAHKTPEDAYDDIVKYFQVVKAQVKFIGEELGSSSGDIIMATDWGSVSYVNAASGFKRRFYFVQDHEPEFYPQGSHAIAARMTYGLELDCICASPWLRELMENKYGRWAKEFWLAVDWNVYFAEGRRKKTSGKTKIAFYARHFTSRRAVELGFLALEGLAQKGLDIEVHCFGANLPFDKAPFDCIDHGIKTPEQLAELYRSCDLGVVFSATNYSLIPQEMMACGLPLVELDVESTRAIFPEEVVTLVSPNPREMAEQLADIVRNPDRMARQAEKALEWVSQFTWEQAASDIEQSLISRLENLGFNKLQVKEDSHKGIKASVVIPTLNGGEVFKRVIKALESQKAPWPYEVLVVDSGSIDGTVEYIQARKNIRLHQIPNCEFQHGRTRNLGASLTEGEYIAFLTQDALPKDEYWLYNMVTHLEHFPEAAGAFGKHLAWPEADPFTKRDLTEHFASFLDNPICVSKDTDKSRWNSQDIGWRQFLHFYSDNNSCMRRSVWEKIPYPEVKFGEDQAWAWEIIKAGYGKVYACQSIVYHSHDFDEGDVEKRAFEEAEFFLSIFGYLIVKKEDADNVINEWNNRDELWGNENNIDKKIIDKRKAANCRKVSGYIKAYSSGRVEK